MTRPPDDRSDDGLTAELREQLEEGAEEARRLAAVLKHQRAARQLVSANQAGRAACPEGYAVVAAAVDWAHAGIGRARPHRPISQPALHTLFGRGSRGDRFAFEEPEIGLACLLRRIGRLADPAGAPHLGSARPHAAAAPPLPLEAGLHGCGARFISDWG